MGARRYTLVHAGRRAVAYISPGKGRAGPSSCPTPQNWVKELKSRHWWLVQLQGIALDYAMCAIANYYTHQRNINCHKVPSQKGSQAHDFYISRLPFACCLLNSFTFCPSFVWGKNRLLSWLRFTTLVPRSPLLPTSDVRIDGGKKVFFRWMPHLVSHACEKKCSGHIRLSQRLFASQMGREKKGKSSILP